MRIVNNVIVDLDEFAERLKEKGYKKNQIVGFLFLLVSCSKGDSDD